MNAYITTGVTFAIVGFLVGCSSPNDGLLDLDSNTIEQSGEIEQQPSDSESQPVIMDDPITGNPVEIAELSETLLIDEVTPESLVSLAGYQSDQLAPLIDLLAYGAIDSALGVGESLSDGEFTTGDSRFGEVVTSIKRTRYNCSGGGTLIREIGRLRLDDISYTHIRNRDGYEFEQCRFNNEQTPMGIGEHVLSGRLVTDTRSRSGSRFGESEANYIWEQFELQGPDEVGYELNGSSSLDSIGGAYVNTASIRTASFDVYRKQQGNVIVEQLTDSAFRQTTVEHQAGILNSIEIELGGTVTGTNTNGHEVLVRTDTPLTHTAAPNFSENYQPFVGQLSLLSSDGGSINLVANPSLNNFSPRENLVMDWSGTMADGTDISRTNVLLENFPFGALNCQYDCCIAH